MYPALFCFWEVMDTEKYELAEKDYMDGMKYKDIAEKYAVSIDTVKSWKKRHDWSREGAARGCTQNIKKGAHKTAHKNQDTKACEGQKKEALHSNEETLPDENQELTEKQKLFCLFYSKNKNAAQSYQKVYGCKYESAMSAGIRLLRNVKVKEYIDYLRDLKKDAIMFGEQDLVELHMRIAFADMGDYVEFDHVGPINSVRFKKSDTVDTQLIQEIKSGKQGISIKLLDKHKSLEWLSRYFECNPMDKHKKEFDNKKLEIELMKLDANIGADEPEAEQEDNFFDALNACGKDVWEDEQH